MLLLRFSKIFKCTTLDWIAVFVYVRFLFIGKFPNNACGWISDETTPWRIFCRAVGRFRGEILEISSFRIRAHTRIIFLRFRRSKRLFFCSEKNRKDFLRDKKTLIVRGRSDKIENRSLRAKAHRQSSATRLHDNVSLQGAMGARTRRKRPARVYFLPV